MQNTKEVKIIKITSDEIEVLIDGYLARIHKSSDLKQIREYHNRINRLWSHLRKASEIIIHTDGSCKNSHNEQLESYGSWGYIIKDLKGNKIKENCERLDSEVEIGGESVHVSNNIAEYLAAVHALQWALDNGYEHAEITLYTDSLLMVKQINRTSRTTSPHLLILRNRIDAFIAKAQKVKIVYVPREKNTNAHDVAEKAYERVDNSRISHLI